MGRDRQSLEMVLRDLGWECAALERGGLPRTHKERAAFESRCAEIVQLAQHLTVWTGLVLLQEQKDFL
jgi:hypothetical protein